jgi:hypothetical protein
MLTVVQKNVLEDLCEKLDLRSPTQLATKYFYERELQENGTNLSSKTPEKIRGYMNRYCKKHGIKKKFSVVRRGFHFRVIAKKI